MYIYIHIYIYIIYICISYIYIYIYDIGYIYDIYIYNIYIYHITNTVAMQIYPWVRHVVVGMYSWRTFFSETDIPGYL